jgi:ribose-phosphate pyrophosphokinase
MVFPGRTSRALARDIAEKMGSPLGQCLVETYPDSEVRIHLNVPVTGQAIFLIQSTGPPSSGEHLLELLLLADACRRAGAERLTAILPYFGYARQDRRARGGEPVGARLIADLLSARFDRVVTVDLHTPAIDGFFALPVEHLTAVPLLAEALRPTLSGKDVLVAPDLGAAKLAQRYAEQLGLPVAYIHKERVNAERVEARRIIGEVRGRRPILVDDMISTGGTIVSAAEALLASGCQPKLLVATSHGLLVGEAIRRLARFPVERILMTDSLEPPPAPHPLPIEVVGLGGMLAQTLGKTVAGDQ